MSGFIAKAACSGHRPSQFANYSGYQRVGLITRLLRERSIARFVVAPTGYGKTCLLVDYAETIFDWAHVFWINGQSPCFIRDLDEGTIAADCRQCDREVRLVVFDDVPALDYTRAEAFSHQIDALIAAKCEVIVACTPRCDSYGFLQRDRIRLGSHDLLLSDEELDGIPVDARNQIESSPNDRSEAYRVPALAWGDGSDSIVRFLKSGFKEPMPSDLMLGMASMLVMRQGGIDALQELGLSETQAIEECADEYPHLGYDPESRRFLTIDVEVDVLASALRGGIDDVVACSKFENRARLVWAWADALMAEERAYQRACNVIRTLCPRQRRGAWLAAHAMELAASGCYYEGIKLAEAVRTNTKSLTASERAVCSAYESVGRMLLGDVSGAIRLAKKLAFDEGAEVAPRICALLVLARIGNETLRTRADKELGEFAAIGMAGAGGALGPWVQLAASWMKASDVGEAASWWVSLAGAKALPWVLDLTASWLFSTLASMCEKGEKETTAFLSADLRQVEVYLRQVLSEGAEHELSFFAASAGIALEQARMNGAQVIEGPIPASSLLVLRQKELLILTQKAHFARDRGLDASRESGARATMSSQDPSLGAANAKIARAVPTLKIRMFGRFEVLIGDDLVENESFRRKHVRLLLLMLAMNLGRETSRDYLAKALWPEASEDAARRNFYTAWSKLRKGLSLSDGTCPYLVRQRHGCSLDVHYTQCDVARLNEICRELLFGKPDFAGWSALYSEIERDFANQLLPSEDSDEAVEQMRIDLRSRLVDALVSATQSLIDGNNLQLATWFARAAIGHDETREDAYVALMHAQIANSQRTAAMMTYHACRRVLADRLGVDPSPETRALYESLLDAL